MLQATQRGCGDSRSAGTAGAERFPFRQLVIEVADDRGDADAAVVAVDE